MVEVNLEKHWSNVPKGWRHFVDSMPPQKITRITKRVKEKLINKLDTSSIEQILDWGCGGGLFSKILSDYGDVSVVDISEDSINSAIKYHRDIKYSQLITNDIKNFKYGGKQVDLLFSNEVIQHFPSYEYFVEVTDIWFNQIKPKTITIQVKLSNITKGTENYNKNYLNGLLLSEVDIIERFGNHNYECVSREYDKTQSGIKMGYFIFKNK